MTPPQPPITCSNCKLVSLCMPAGLQPAELSRIEQIVTTRRKVKRHETLFRSGEAFTSLYAIRTGVFKTTVTSANGHGQVAGFHLPGQLVGFDGIADRQHTCDAVPLEDGEVCLIPFDRIEELSREIRGIQHQVHRLMSREIVREHGMMLLLGSMRAEERLARFLLNLAERLHVLGFSQSELVLSMTREEIGSYVGLTLETVSRTLSKFVHAGLVEVEKRHVRISNIEALRTMISPPT